MTNNYFSEFVKKTSPQKPITLNANPLGLNNKFFCPNSWQRDNWMVSDMLCGRKLPDVTVITGGNFDISTALAGCGSPSSCNKLDTKDMILAGVLNNPQLLTTGAQILGNLGAGIMNFFGLGSNDNATNTTGNMINIGGQDVKVGQNGIFNVGNGQVVQGTLNADGTVTGADGNSYKPTRYAGTMVNSGTGTVVNSGTGTVVNSGTGTVVNSGTGTAVNSGARAAVNPGGDQVVPGTLKPDGTVTGADGNSYKPTGYKGLSYNPDAGSMNFGKLISEVGLNGDASSTVSVESDKKIQAADSAINKYNNAVESKDKKAIESAKNEAQTALGEINSQISNLEGQLSKVEADITNTEKEIATSSQEAQQNKNQLDGAKEDRNNARDAVNATKGKIDEQNSLITSKTQELTAEVNRKQNAYNQAASAYRTAQKAPTESDAQFAERKAELQRKMNEARGALEAAKENKEKTLKELNTQLEGLKIKLGQEEGVLKEKEDAVKGLEGTATKLDEVKQALMARKEEIQAQLEEYKNKKIELERAAAENGEKFEAAQQSEQQEGA